MRSWFDNLLTMLLSCSVFLTALVPPAVSHSHTVSDLPHTQKVSEQEQCQQAHIHNHTHGNGHSHHHQQTSCPENSGSQTKRHSEAIPVSAAHVHFTFFGLSLSLPSPHDAGSNAPFMPGDYGDESGVIRITDDTLTVSRVDITSAVDVSIALLVTVDAAVALESEAAQRRHRTAADHIRLCDSARHERSGVLLI